MIAFIVRVSLRTQLFIMTENMNTLFIRIGCGDNVYIGRLWDTLPGSDIYRVP